MDCSHDNQSQTGKNHDIGMYGRGLYVLYSSKWYQNVSRNKITLWSETYSIIFSRLFFCFLICNLGVCFVIRFQETDAKVRGRGVDPYTFIFDDNMTENSLSPGTHVNIVIICAVPENSTSFSIMLLCIVGVDGCTEQSTGISSGGFQSTIATPRHTTSHREESSLEGRQNVIC